MTKTDEAFRTRGRSRHTLYFHLHQTLNESNVHKTPMLFILIKNIYVNYGLC